MFAACSAFRTTAVEVGLTQEACWDKCHCGSGTNTYRCLEESACDLLPSYDLTSVRNRSRFRRLPWCYIPDSVWSLLGGYSCIAVWKRLNSWTDIVHTNSTRTSLQSKSPFLIPGHQFGSCLCIWVGYRTCFRQRAAENVETWDIWMYNDLWDDWWYSLWLMQSCELWTFIEAWDTASIILMLEYCQLPHLLRTTCNLL